MCIFFCNFAAGLCFLLEKHVLVLFEMYERSNKKSIYES